ncbi:MAG: glycosyltransferase [Ferrimicrobium sp.]
MTDVPELLPMSISIIVPAYNEAPRILTVLHELHPQQATWHFGEVIVVNDSSTDATASIAHSIEGVIVVDQLAGKKGKGAAIETGLQHSSGEIIVTCDADLESPSRNRLLALAVTLANNQHLHLVKAAYLDPTALNGRGGGRVTELLAKPMLEAFFPPLALLASPLAGEMSFWRTDPAALALEQTYGFDIALALDIGIQHGWDSIAEIPFGQKFHHHQSLASLSQQAREVLEAILMRAASTGTSLEHACVAIERSTRIADPD